MNFRYGILDGVLPDKELLRIACPVEQAVGCWPQSSKDKT